MIIKRNLKSQMPSLKRYKPGGDSAAGDEDDSNSAFAALTRKKRKIVNGNNNNGSNGYYPLNLLGDVATGVFNIPLSLRGLLGAPEKPEKGFGDAALSSDVSCSPPGKLESETKSRRGGDWRREINRTANGDANVSRPPLVRTSRGRVQVLPSRFNDSVIENWRKESKTSLRDYSFDDDADYKREKHYSKKAPKSCSYQQSSKNKRSDDRIGYYKNRKGATLCEEEEEKEEVVEEEDREAMVVYKNFDIRKYSSSRSSLTSLAVEDEKCLHMDVVDLESEDGELLLKEDGEKNDGLYGPEDFYSGDIVWAKAGKKDPFWPAIVIDPMTQAPELVLRSCIAEAACVMFLGHAENENQRVLKLLDYYFPIKR